jgi:stage II sporulation protein AA (anti-sigma F factor antagonist)
MSLSVHLFIKQDTLFIRLRGELDHHTSIELRERINILMNEYVVKNIVFNMQELTFMDSSGIGVILGRFNQVKRNSGLLLVCNLNNTIERIIRLSGLYKILVITKDEEQAENYLGVA